MLMFEVTRADKILELPSIFSLKSGYALVSLTASLMAVAGHPAMRGYAPDYMMQDLCGPATPGSGRLPVISAKVLTNPSIDDLSVSNTRLCTVVQQTFLHAP